MNEMYNVIWPGWQIVRRIGSGSFGTVYEIQRDVYGDIERAALKVIKLPRSEDEVDYLRCTGLDDASITMNFHQQVGDIAKEYKLMAQMRENPNVVRCDDFRDIQHDDGLGWDIYIKMELLSPLMKNLDKVATEQQIIQLGKDICNALIACQEKNIIHRDIKPQNVFVSEAGVFKLGDFGIARTIERTTHATAGIGTYSYMAPEVEKNQPYGRPADIYSLGLMMYWLLNERRGAFMPLPPAVPGYGDEETARQRRFAGEPIPAPKHGSNALKTIVLKACAFNPGDRYQSAQEMWDALNQLGGTAPAAAPVAATVAAAAQYDYQAPSVAPQPSVAPTPVASAPIYNNIPQETYEEEATIGPAFHTASQKPAPQKPAKPAKEEKPKQEQPPRQERPAKRKSPALFIILGVVGTILTLVLLISLVSCDTDEPSYYDPYETIDVTPEASSTASTEATEDTEPVGTAPALQADWSEWAEKLPENVTADNYEIEEKTFYSSRTLETTSSSNKTMDGWELFDTVEAGDGYGPWSSWSQSAAKESSTRDVETQTRYRYRTKETTVSTSSSKSGWTQYGAPTTSWGNYGAWSSWSTSAVSGSDSRKVETKTQYRYRNISGSGGYSEWSGWSQWSDTPVSANDLRQVETRTVSSYFYYQCNNCSLRWYTNSAPCTGCGNSNFSYRTGSGNLIMDPAPFMGSGYYQSNDGTGMVFMNSAGGATQYRYRTRTQLAGSTGSWSAWGDTPYAASSSREVETRKVYRYCDRSKTTVYNYYRWGSWSSWSTNKPTASDSRQVENTTFYRYRDKVSNTTYYFRRWTEWSEFTEGEITASDTVEVKTQKQYRYKSKS